MNNSQQIAQNGIDLLHRSEFRQFSDVVLGEEKVGETAIVCPLHIGQMLISYLIGERDNYRNLQQETLNTFKKEITTTFNLKELEQLCDALGIPLAELGTGTLSGRALALVQYGRRYGRLAELTAYCRRERPYGSWPQFPVVDKPTIRQKSNLAVVICINQLALEQAAGYLADNQIDSNFVLLTTTPDYSQIQWLPTKKEWSPAVQDFYQTMQHQALKIPRMRRHFFFATPLPYAFAIGCAWGLVHQGDELYHWDGKGYVHVMTSTRDWKSA